MKVAYITYDEEKYPVIVGYRAIKKSREEDPKAKIVLAKDGTAIGGKIEDNEALLWYSLESGKYAVDKTTKLSFKREEMEFVLDECFIEFMKLVKIFTDSVQGEQMPGNQPPNRASRRKESS